MHSEPAATPWRTAATAAGLAAVSLLAFLSALTTGFTSDDFFILSRVKALDGLADPLAYFQLGFFDYYRPAAFLSHALDWQVWGQNPFGFHLANLILHAANTTLVFAIGLRLLKFSAATVAALLFALHPASHEAVYWIAARFDLLATCFTLAAVWCLADDRRGWRAAGVVAFGLGLLSKESAISLLVIAPAWDVFVARRRFRECARRLLPLVIVVAGYAAVRSLGADLDAAGGRVSKLLIVAAALGLIGHAAWQRERPPARASSDRVPPLGLAVALGVLITVGLWGPARVASSVAKGLGASAYDAFYLVSPIVFPSPPAAWFDPAVPADVLPGLVVVWSALFGLAIWGRVIAREASALFLCVFIAASLIPVSSMTGGLRYLYLATAGVSLLAAWVLQQVPWRARLGAVAIVAIVLALSLTQVVQAGRSWRAGADMTRDGVKLMAASLPPCGTKDVLLLTAPIGIGGVYANINYEAFDVLERCSPRNFFTMLRVLDRDVHVDVTTVVEGVVELRVPSYVGNIVASEDLRHFTVAIPAGLRRSIETPIGQIETFAEKTTQVFRVTLTGPARTAGRFYYSDGQVKHP